MNESLLIKVPIHVWSHFEQPTDSEDSWEKIEEDDNLEGIDVALGSLQGVYSLENLSVRLQEHTLTRYRRTLGLWPLVDSVLDVEFNIAAEEATASLLRELDDRTRLIMMRYFGLGGYPEGTLEEVGSHFGLTRERVRQIYNLAMETFETLERREKRGVLDTWGLTPLKDARQVLESYDGLRGS